MFMIGFAMCQKVQLTEDVAVDVAADPVGGGQVLGAAVAAEAAAVEERVADLTDFFRRRKGKLTAHTPGNKNMANKTKRSAVYKINKIE